MLNIPQAIKDLFKSDNVLKNIRISFPNEEYEDICNDRIIKESLKFDESISSREEIKWGLCENSQLSFECVDVSNIRGMEIEAAVEIDATDVNPTEEYSCVEFDPLIFMARLSGRDLIFLICDFPEREAGATPYEAQDGTGITWRYIDGASYETTDQVGNAYANESLSLDTYRQKTGVDPRGTYDDMYDGYHGGGYERTYLYSVTTGKFYKCLEISYFPYPYVEMRAVLADGFSNNEWLDAIGDIEWDPQKRKYIYHFDADIHTSPDVPFPFYKIPLGRFIVDEAKRNAGMTRRKIVAYSDLTNFSIPRYINEITSAESLNLHIINFLQVAKKSRFLDENLFNYANLPLATADLHRPFQWRHTPMWQYQDGSTLLDISLSAIVTYGYVEIDADDFPSMRVLLKCNDSGVWDVDRDTIEYNLDLFIKAAMEYTGDSAINYSEKVLHQTENLIKNAIRPLPYINSIPKEYLIGIEVGEVYPTSSKIYFVENIEMTLRVREHGASPTIGDIVFQYIFDNHRTIEFADYQIVDTSYFPQNTLLIKGNPIDDTNTSFQYLLSFLNLNSETILESCIELNGYFGRMGRDGYFQLLALAEIPINGLFPAHNIYPDLHLYPCAYTPITADVSDLAIIDDDDTISLWYEEYFIQYGTLICEYTSSEVLDENDNPMQVLYEDQFTEGDGLMVYNLSNNAIIKSGVWTSAEIQALVDPLVQVLKRVKFYPSDLTCIGLPYIEAGDWVLASYHGNQILGLILSRTLSGIQALRDKMKSD